MTNFEWLAEEADKYWKGKKQDLSETAIYNLDDYDVT